MNRLTLVAICAAAALSLGFVPVAHDTADAQPVSNEVTPDVQVQVQVQPSLDDGLLMSMPDEPLKKCGFDSDCSHGKCKKGQCGGCGFDSDCKGWGKCKKGQCGGCGFDSECKGHGKCSSGQCTKSPYK